MAFDLRDAVPPPQFFIAGAPRCGTTALSTWLAGHPAICFSRPKETHYFVTSGDHPSAGETIEKLQRDYFSKYFAHLSGKSEWLGEGSVSYLYSPAAIERILAINPSARFIVMVRNPLEMLPSYHARLLYTLDEEVTDFAAAWRLQEVRAQGRQIPRDCREPQLLRYREIGSMGRHLKQLIDMAGRRRVMTVVYDDLVRDSREVYLRALDFLGLPDDGRADFPRVRESRGYRSRRLHRLIKRPPPLIMRAVGPKPLDANRAGGQQAGIWQPPLRRLRKILKRLNQAPGTYPALSADVAVELGEFFAGDVACLGRLLGRDLSHWLSGTHAGRPATARSGAKILEKGGVAAS
jgi:hypothetical protein